MWPWPVTATMWSRGPAVTVRVAVPVGPVGARHGVGAGDGGAAAGPGAAPVGGDGEGGGPRHVTEGVVVGVEAGGGVGLGSPGPDGGRGR